MRRHVILLMVIAALIAAVALLRPLRSPPALPALNADPPLGTVPLASVVHTEESASILPEVERAVISVTPPQVETSAPAEKGIIRNIPCQVTVFGTDGHPAEGAMVTVISADIEWAQRDTKLLATDSRGVVTFNMRNDRQVMIYAYKPRGGGSTTWIGTFRNDRFVQLILKESVTMKLLCVGTEGLPLENVEIEVIMEELFSSRFDVNGNHLGSTYIWIPPRKAYSDRDGRCQIEGLTSKGWNRTNGVRIPGSKFIVTATLGRRTTERRFDDFPEEDVVLVLDQ